MVIDKSKPQLTSGEKAALKKEKAKVNKAKANPAVRRPHHAGHLRIGWHCVLVVRTDVDVLRRDHFLLQNLESYPITSLL